MSTAMSKRLEGKTILITGASSGIGKSTALEFARTAPKNLKIIITARRLEALEQLKSDIEKEVGEGVKVLPVKLNIANPAEVREFVGKLPQEFKDINVLVNNAGLVKGVAKAPEIAEEDMNTMFATNVTGLINMTQAVLPVFLARSGELPGTGDIINVGSIAGREPYPGGSIYCATKAAVRSFTDSLRKELIATRIRVMEIDPGQVETEFSVVRFYGDKSKADKVYEGCEPLTPDDIAEVVVFAAGRRENVVVADTLVFPNHQVSLDVPFLFAFQSLIPGWKRPLLRLCTERTRDKQAFPLRVWIYVSNRIYHRLVQEEATRTSALLNQKSRSHRYKPRRNQDHFQFTLAYLLEDSETITKVFIHAAFS
jgi:3-hydroxy acid dehydrogenase/malonic semialdehyde reductase